MGNIHNCKLSSLGTLSEKIVEAFHSVGKNGDNKIDDMDTPNLVKCGLICLDKALDGNGDGDRLTLDPSEVTVVCHDCTASTSDSFSSSLLYISKSVIKEAIEEGDYCI